MVTNVLPPFLWFTVYMAENLQLEYTNIQMSCITPVASLGGGRGTAPGDTLQGVTPERKNILWLNLHRIVDKRGRTGKKVGVTPSRGDSRVK